MSHTGPAPSTRSAQLGAADPNPSRPVGPERVLLALYLLFLVAAGSRSVVQLSTHPGRAPLAYLLSLTAAVVYAVGLALIRHTHRRNAGARVLRVWSLLELAAVLAVGTATVLDHAAFPDATVWSYYGAGYLFIPLLLPVAVLSWLHTQHRRTPAPTRRSSRPQDL